MQWGEPPLPGPLLHKCVEEREKTPEPSLHEPAVVEACHTNIVSKVLAGPADI